MLTLSDGSFQGFSGTSAWTFSTKPSGPPAGSTRLVVSPDGSGDFNTVQGAVDWVPDSHSTRTTIFIRNGFYEEVVYFRNKSNITFLGEDRDTVQVFYANTEVFNPHPVNVATNKWPGTFPSRRAAFMADNSTGIHLVNLTLRNAAKGQAEGLLLAGQRNIVSHVTIVGSGDALQRCSNGVALPGATTATLRLENVWAGDTGRYTVAATNGSRTDTSRAAVLSVK